jgi:hypothetical protein
VDARLELFELEQLEAAQRARRTGELVVNEFPFRVERQVMAIVVENGSHCIRIHLESCKDRLQRVEGY